MSLAKMAAGCCSIFIVSLFLIGCPPTPPAPPKAPVAEFYGALYEAPEAEVAPETEGKSDSDLINPNTPLEGFEPMAVQFTDLSEEGTSEITIWRWDFGDGEVSDEQNPVHTYEKAGAYTVSLLVGSGAGNSRVIKKDYILVTETELPVADFSYTPKIGLPPFFVRFKDLSELGTGKAIYWLWDFGDGETSTQQHPWHEYKEVGVYTVSLTVITEVGQSTKTVEAAVDSRGALEASFTADPVTGNNTLTTTFTDTSSFGPAEAIAWQWDFGDGATSTLQHPAHTYIHPGVYTVTLTVVTEFGSSTYTEEDLITVEEVTDPVVDFSGSPLKGLTPLTVVFRDLSIPGGNAITSYFWDFGDGVTSTEQSPLHEYTEAGSYTVSLTIGTEAGVDLVEMKEGYIDVAAPLEAAFTADPVFGYNRLTTVFSNTSTYGLAEEIAWEWDFGDGSLSTLEHPTHTYVAPGVYTVSLRVVTELGTRVYTEEDLVTVEETTEPVAEFNGSPKEGMAPLTVVFTDLSSDGGKPITGYAWDFGDGATSTEQSPLHIYEEAGAYTVKLTITTEDGDAEPEEKENYIKVYQPLAASFAALPEAGSAPLEVSFTNTSTYGMAEEVHWLWDFGDGARGTLENPVHTYIHEGRYTVSLTVITELGTSLYTEENLIAVTAEAFAEAAFSASPLRGLAPLTVSFEDLSTASKPITGYVWDFGDETTSTEENPLHLYKEAGVYTVTLTVSTEDGDSEPKVETEYITVLAPLAASFTADPVSILQGEEVTFTNTSSPGLSATQAYQWDFGDGGVSTESDPVHIYSTIGVFSVTLTMITDLGVDRVTETDLITVGLKTPPTASFEADILSGRAPLAVQFTDLSTPGSSEITAWAWDFGDGESSTEQSPAHTYTLKGRHTVVLTVFSEHGDHTVTEEAFITVVASELVIGGEDSDIAGAMVYLEDGGYAVAGSTLSYGEGDSDMYLTRIDAAGNTLWEQSYAYATGEDFSEDKANALLTTPEGGFILAGSTTSQAGLSDVFMVFTDGQGNEINRNSMPTARNEFVNAMQWGPASSLVMAGGVETEDQGWDMLLIKTDAAGNRIWKRTFGGEEYDIATAVVTVGNDGFAFAGTTSSYGLTFDMLLHRTDADGEAIWSRRYGVLKDTSCEAICLTERGEFILAGATSNTEEDIDLRVFRVDANGAARWDVQEGGAGNDWATAVMNDDADAIVIAGGSSSNDAGTLDAFLMKLDGDGQSLWFDSATSDAWAYRYGGEGNQVAYDLVQAADGGYTLAGSTDGPGEGVMDIYVLHTDAGGAQTPFPLPVAEEE